MPPTLTDMRMALITAFMANDTQAYDEADRALRGWLRLKGVKGDARRKSKRPSEQSA